MPPNISIRYCQVFLFFCMMLGIYKGRKLTKPDVFEIDGPNFGEKIQRLETTYLNPFNFPFNFRTPMRKN